jgi:hypothetical protein
MIRTETACLCQLHNQFVVSCKLHANIESQQFMCLVAHNEFCALTEHTKENSFVCWVPIAGLRALCVVTNSRSSVVLMNYLLICLKRLVTASWKCIYRVQQILSFRGRIWRHTASLEQEANLRLDKETNWNQAVTQYKPAVQYRGIGVSSNARQILVERTKQSRALADSGLDELGFRHWHCHWQSQ